MKILAFDLGTNTGWAVTAPSDEKCPFTYGTLDLKGSRYSGGGMRYVIFRKHVIEMLDAMEPDMVVYEEVRRHLGTDAAHVYGGLKAHLVEVCETRGVPYEGVPVGTIKRFATGKGNASKLQMVQEAEEQWRLDLKQNDNEADALWLCAYAVKEYGHE